MSGYRGKRAFDVIVSVPALIASLPIQLLTALAVRVMLGSPVLFKQTRPGLDGEPFELMKFRTMLPEDSRLGLVDNESRHTPFGRALRATSLDELPSLMNVVRGDMSLVGPRPLLMRYLALYSPEQARRHEVRPGLTGLAQVAGRNEVPWEQRFELDVFYVDNASPLLDLKILLRTVVKVFRREGITPKEGDVVTPFQGAVDGHARV